MKLALFTLLALSSIHSQPRSIDPPAKNDSGMPFLTSGPDGAVYLAWTESTPAKENALRFSKWNGVTWSAPETIAQGRHWFTNWADFGSLTVLKDGSMLAHWLPRAEAGSKFGYGIRIARRDPDKPVWRNIHGVSLDEKVDYAGFFTFAPQSGAATYLAPPSDGTKTSSAHDHDAEGHRKTLRFVEFRADGSVGAENEIDADVCSCCQTALGKTRTGWIAAYRDHLPGEIRDISVIRYAAGAWTAPQPLHRDGWKINGCPTDGPSLHSGGGSRVAIAWLTRANGVPKVQLAISKDDGRTFGAPLRIDSGNPLGRPSIALYDESTYLITWLERLASGQVEVRIRRVTADGAASEPITVSQAPLGRASGFPKAIVSGDNIILAWRDDRVRAVLLKKSDLKDKK